MKTKRFAAAAMAVLMAAGMTAASSPAFATTGETTAPAAEMAASAAEAKYVVGVCQLVQHAALDAATQGFVDTLVAEYGKDIYIDVQNAQGESGTCATIVNGFVTNSYNLIMANATPALQSAIAATTDIPILGTSVTDYGTALSMQDFAGTTGINVSGTSDLAPLDQQEDMILELVPEAKKVSILYCSAEPNSKFQASEIEKYLDEDKVAYEEFAFSDSNDLQSVVQSAVADCDAMYIPTDNTAASNMPLVYNVASAAKIPVICGEENMCGAGGLATLSISYYDLGAATGKQAIEILSNGASPAEMPIEYASATTKKFNADYAEAIGFTMPEGYEAIEKAQ